MSEPTNSELMSSMVALQSTVSSLVTTLSEVQSALVDLHSAMTYGFARVDGRFGSLEADVTAIRGEVSGMQRWMARSDERFTALEQRA